MKAKRVHLHKIPFDYFEKQPSTAGVCLWTEQGSVCVCVWSSSRTYLGSLARMLVFRGLPGPRKSNNRPGKLECLFLSVLHKNAHTIPKTVLLHSLSVRSVLFSHRSVCGADCAGFWNPFTCRWCKTWQKINFYNIMTKRPAKYRPQY